MSLTMSVSGTGLFFAALAALVGFFVASDVAVVDSNILDDDRLGRVVFKNMVVMYTIANVVVYSMTALSPLPPRSETRAATVAEVTSHFGLESGKEYPLQLGERFAGTSGDMRVVGGIFTPTVQAHGIRRQDSQLGSLPRMADPISLRFQWRK